MKLLLPELPKHEITRHYVMIANETTSLIRVKPNTLEEVLLKTRENCAEVIKKFPEGMKDHILRTIT